MGAIRQLPSRTARCNLLSNEYVYGCQTILGTTLIHNLLCNPPPMTLVAAHCKLKLRCTIPSPPLACEGHYHSIQAFSCAPWCLACYYICPVYCSFCTDPPQLLSPARAYVRAEADLNTVSTVIVPPHTVQRLYCRGGPLSHILSPLLLKPGRSDRQSLPVESSTRHFA